MCSRSCEVGLVKCVVDLVKFKVGLVKCVVDLVKSDL